MLASRSETIAVRGLNIHVRHWGREGAPMLFMLHGWMDVSASFQFAVDELAALGCDWHFIAPDWRGFGLSQRTAGDTYWFADYVADLDAILRRYSPDHAVHLLGHSMGANIAGVYAGARPERIRKFINLEGVGMRTSTPDQAPGHYAAWLEQLGKPARMLSYPSRQAVAVRLQQNNPRLSDERAAFLSRHWAAQNDGGRWEILGDPLHRRSSPLLYHVEEVMACWAAIKAPVLWVEASETDIWKWMGSKADARREVDRRLTHLADVTKRMIDDAGHMLHHDQPAALARLVLDFLA